MKSLDDIKRLNQLLINEAQQEYDAWSQDENGYDHEVGNGGICHLIADKVAGVLLHNGIEAITFSLDSEVHVVVIAQCQEGVYFIDIPHYLYEAGGGYVWTKKLNVTFDEHSVTYTKIYADPERFKEYLD